MTDLAETLSAIHCEVFPQGWSLQSMAETLAVPGTFALVVPPPAGGRLGGGLSSENSNSSHMRPHPNPPPSGEGIGMIIIRALAEQADLVTLAVLPAHRRHGVAEKLLREAMRQAAGRGAESLFLEVGESNIPARKLYEKCGFLPISRRKAYYGGSEDAIVMRRNLDERSED